MIAQSPQHKTAVPTDVKPSATSRPVIWQRLKDQIEVLEFPSSTVATASADSEFRLLQSGPFQEGKQSLPFSTAAIKSGMQALRGAARLVKGRTDFSEEIQSRFHEPEKLIAALMPKILAFSEAYKLSDPELKIDATLADLRTRNPKDFAAAFKKIIERVGTETGFFDSFKALGIFEGFKQGFSDGEAGTLRIKFKQTQLIKCAAFATIVPEDGKILVAGPRPDQVEVLTALLQGRLDFCSSAILHEVVHSTQYKRCPDTRTLSGKFSAYLLKVVHGGAGFGPGSVAKFAREAHAFLVNQTYESHSTDFWWPASDCKSSIANPAFGYIKTKQLAPGQPTNVADDQNISIDGHLYQTTDLIKLNQATLAILSLKYLGHSEQAIGQLIQQSRWDEQNHEFTALSDQLRQDRLKHGLQDDTDFAIVMSGLSALEQLQYCANKNLAAKIVADELSNLLDKGQEASSLDPVGPSSWLAWVAALNFRNFTTE